MVENPMVVGNQHDKASDDNLHSFDVNGNEIHYGDAYLEIFGDKIPKDFDSLLDYMTENLGAVERVAED